MVEIPETSLSVGFALLQLAEAQREDSRRLHLGASEIGDECLRRIWYSFRWVSDGARDGRALRILRRGKAEEQQMLQDLRDLGWEVLRGEDFRVSLASGHFGGTPDGVVRGVPAAPAKWHILELKTANDANWKKLAKLGVKEAQPAHYAQMQVYMLGREIDRALYLSINKNDDTVYEERVELNRIEATRLVERATRAIDRHTLPERISDDPDWFQCRMCRHHATCFEPKFPLRTCRTCLHVETFTPAGWRCTKHDRVLDEADQKTGCGDHRYLPSLLHWLQQMDATDSVVIYDTWVDKGQHEP